MLCRKSKNRISPGIPGIPAKKADPLNKR